MTCSSTQTIFPLFLPPVKSFSLPAKYCTSRTTNQLTVEYMHLHTSPPCTHTIIVTLFRQNTFFREPMVQRATKKMLLSKNTLYSNIHMLYMVWELRKFLSCFGLKHKQIINVYLHRNQQTYTSCANMQLKIIIFWFGQILSRCFTIFSRQCIHHRKGNFICYSLSTTIKPTAVFSKQNNVTFSLI